MTEVDFPKKPTPTLEEVREQFYIWRQGRKGRARIPDELWRTAVELTSRHTVNHVAKALALNHTTLKQKTGHYRPLDPICSNITTKAPESFVELNWPQAEISEYNLELEDATGRKLKLSIKGGHGNEIFEMVKLFCGVAG